ncbi:MULTISPECIES: cellulose biosynthesis cyclic di-GMP-binding regulatory protein BcsB [unclassified Vibrio]|uniref:Cyclic di-GMP-binding protein n=1 Tax=Vibrio sp. HB236076 TaxID=3232307 RepID=A0AB39HE49_9VIBR|nr:cellulose biosynthesis cyclic di-GMP-binding regulatory protein BcsB [Vibrio sp. HB161653]MDP5255363.1 cellulose biosynthesis cyclic di-GMP-binding regulatory protein BcsB [Vibrio sp. HB161653]
MTIPFLNHLSRLSAILLSTLMVLWASQAQAMVHHHLPLSPFYGGNNTLRLEGERASANISIPVSPLASIKSAQLHLEATTSIALLQRQSVLSIRFNDITIGQIELNANKPLISADLSIPKDLWRAEYNNLTFAVSQHSQLCQDPDAPELWTEINLNRSTLSIDDAIEAKPMRLQSLSGFFHPGIGGQHQADIFTIDGDKGLKALSQKALPLIAQGVAIREQYRSVTFTHHTISPANAPTDESLSGANNNRRSSWYLPKQSPLEQLHIVAATREALKPLVSDRVYQQINGPFLLIQQTPTAEGVTQSASARERHYRLLVSGVTADDVIQAADTLAHMDDVLNPDDQLTILSQHNSAETLDQQRMVLHPGKTYAFSQLGQAPLYFTGRGSFSQNMTVRLPADFYPAENAKIKLSLNFGYGAGFGTGSILNISVNGDVVHSVPLDEVQGHAYRDFVFTIPARYFSGGFNNLNFYVNQNTPQVSGQCTDVYGGYLRFNLNNTSEITIPEASHIARQPDLRLMTQTGYPFAQFNNQEVSNIYLASPAMLSPALTLIGKMAQSAGNILPNLTIENTIPEQLSANAIVLATPEQLSPALFDNVTTSITKTKNWAYRLQNTLYNLVAQQPLDSQAEPIAASSFTEQKSSLGPLSILLGTKNPLSERVGTLVILTADSAELLKKRTEELVDNQMWGQIHGDFFAWQSGEKPALVMQTSAPYNIGHEETFMEIRAWLSQNPWYWLLITVSLVILVAILAFILLKRKHRQVEEQWQQ